MVATASAFCTITRLRPFRLGRGGRGAFSRRARRRRGACLESTSSPTRSKWATRSRMSTTARTGTRGRAPIADADMARIGGLARLERLDLADSGVSDAGLNRVRGLAHLTWLSLYDCRVTDAGLDDLKGLTRLRTLVLGETQVTDAGLDRLKGFRQLRDLYLPHDRVTPDGVARLQRALPKCEISFRAPGVFEVRESPAGTTVPDRRVEQRALLSRHAPGRGGIRPEPILRHDRR